MSVKDDHSINRSPPGCRPFSPKDSPGRLKSIGCFILSCPGRRRIFSSSLYRPSNSGGINRKPFPHRLLLMDRPSQPPWGMTRRISSLEPTSRKNFIFGYFIPITDLILDNSAKPVPGPPAAGAGGLRLPAQRHLWLHRFQPQPFYLLNLTDSRGDLSNSNNRLFWPQLA